MKAAYVRAIRGLDAVIRRLGLLPKLDRLARRSRSATWFRSMLAIYDLDGLVGLDTPWWTFRSADIVARHLSARSDASVFEWGSGASTVWLSSRAGHVVTIEHDRAWADKVRPLIGSNATVLIIPPAAASSVSSVLSNKRGYEGLDFTEYVLAIQAYPVEFDLIVIDGRAREACLPVALRHLAADGMIVFDNVDRKRYRNAIEAEPDIEVLTTRGLTPALPYPTRTALIRKSQRK